MLVLNSFRTGWSSFPQRVRLERGEDWLRISVFAPEWADHLSLANGATLSTISEGGSQATGTCARKLVREHCVFLPTRHRLRCQPPWRQGSAFRTLGRAIAQTLYELRILLLYPTYSRQWGTHSRTKSQEEYRTKQVPERESMAVCGESRVNERRGELHIR